MERYFLKYVRKNGYPMKRPMNFELFEDAIRFAFEKMDADLWAGWALYEVPDAWNWNVTPPEDKFEMLCMSKNWMQLI